MKNSIVITNNDKLTTLIGIVNDVSPFLVKNMYKYMQECKYSIWAEHCHYQDESAAEYMIARLRDNMQACLSQSMINDIASRYSMAIEYQAQAQYLQLDTEEQQDQEAFWERSDAQADFDDKMSMYYNEY